MPMKLYGIEHLVKRGFVLQIGLSILDGVLGQRVRSPGDVPYQDDTQSSGDDSRTRHWLRSGPRQRTHTHFQDAYAREFRSGPSVSFLILIALQSSSRFDLTVFKMNCVIICI